MARNKDFSEEEVLSKAADVFTRLGYSATSLSTLTQELSVGKQSLYNAFGDKEALYLQALQHASQHSAIGNSLAHPGKTGVQRIQDFFDVLLSECCDETHPGCMVSAGILEQDKKSSSGMELQRIWAQTQELLRSTIEDGQREGGISSQRRSAELAQMLMATMSGLRVMRKAISDPSTRRQTLQQVINLNLELLQR